MNLKICENVFVLEVKGQQGRENEKVSVITWVLLKVQKQIWEINGRCQLAQWCTCQHILYKLKAKF